MNKKPTYEQLEQRIKELEHANHKSKQNGALIGHYNFLQTLVDSIPAPIFYKDAQGIYTGCNKAFEKFLDKRKEDIVGKTVHGVSPSDLAQTYHEKDLELMKEGGVQIYESSVQYADGTLRDVVFHKAPFRKTDENLGGLIGVILDITERKRAEEALRESEARFKAIFEFANDGILVGNVSTKKFVLANQKICDMLGYSNDELLDLSVSDIHPKDDLPAVIKAFDDQAKNKYLLAENLPVQRKDGTVFYADVNSTPFNIGDDLFLLGIFRDITERKKAEDEKKMLQDQLYQSEKMSAIGQLAAGVAHEINNPIGFISSNIRTLDDYQNDLSNLIHQYKSLVSFLKENNHNSSSVKEQLKAIISTEEDIDIDYILEDINNLIAETIEGTERVKNIVIDLKDFAHPGNDNKSKVDMNKGIESTLNMVWNELKYKTTVTKELGKLPHVMGYPQQLNQVFMNIIVNAAQAIEEKGEIHIKTQHQNEFIEVIISDTGSGIPEENLAKLFDPFFTTKEVGKGTGMGLNISYNIVKQHNGTIDVKSKLGEGTTFTIKIPVEDS